MIASFNPRPPILAGDASEVDETEVIDLPVSIHARQYWRAMLAATRGDLRIEWFQSTPANTGGRCCCIGCYRFPPNRFNPRPPILAGDAE